MRPSTSSRQSRAAEPTSRLDPAQAARRPQHVSTADPGSAQARCLPPSRPRTAMVLHLVHPAQGGRPLLSQLPPAAVRRRKVHARRMHQPAAQQIEAARLDRGKTMSRMPAVRASSACRRPTAGSHDASTSVRSESSPGWKSRRLVAETSRREEVARAARPPPDRAARGRRLPHARIDRNQSGGSELQAHAAPARAPAGEKATRRVQSRQRARASAAAVEGTSRPVSIALISARKSRPPAQLRLRPTRAPPASSEVVLHHRDPRHDRVLSPSDEPARIET